MSLGDVVMFVIMLTVKKKKKSPKMRQREECRGHITYVWWVT